MNQSIRFGTNGGKHKKKQSENLRAWVPNRRNHLPFFSSIYKYNSIHPSDRRSHSRALSLCRLASRSLSFSLLANSFFSYSRTVENCSSVGFFDDGPLNCVSVFPLPIADVEANPPVIVCNCESINSAPDQR